MPNQQAGDTGSTDEVDRVGSNRWAARQKGENVPAGKHMTVSVQILQVPPPATKKEAHRKQKRFEKVGNVVSMGKEKLKALHSKHRGT